MAGSAPTGNQNGGCDRTEVVRYRAFVIARVAITGNAAGGSFVLDNFAFDESDMAPVPGTKRISAGWPVGARTGEGLRSATSDSGP